MYLLYCLYNFVNDLKQQKLVTSRSGSGDSSHRRDRTHTSHIRIKRKLVTFQFQFRRAQNKSNTFLIKLNTYPLVNYYEMLLKSDTQDRYIKCRLFYSLYMLNTNLARTAPQFSKMTGLFCRVCLVYICVLLYSQPNKNTATTQIFIYKHTIYVCINKKR